MKTVCFLQSPRIFLFNDLCVYGGTELPTWINIITLIIMSVTAISTPPLIIVKNLYDFNNLFSFFFLQNSLYIPPRGPLCDDFSEDAELSSLVSIKPNRNCSQWLSSVSDMKEWVTAYRLISADLTLRRGWGKDEGFWLEFIWFEWRIIKIYLTDTSFQVVYSGAYWTGISVSLQNWLSPAGTRVTSNMTSSTIAGTKLLCETKLKWPQVLISQHSCRMC